LSTYDQLKIKKLDKIEVRMNAFLEFEDPSSKGSALTVIPFEAKYVFLAGF